MAGPALIDTESATLPAHRESVRYVYSGGQLRNQLSLDLPRVLAAEAPRVVGALLMRRGLGVADVRHWAVHPGGQKVIDSLAGALGLDERQLAVTREVLRDRGNVSSATVWFELERILRDGVLPGEYCVILAAGAGLSIHAALLQA